MFYQLSQSTKICRRMRCIGSNIYYTAIRGGCQDRRRENFLLSVWRAAKARGMGFVPRPTPFTAQLTRVPASAPADKPPRTLAVQHTRTFPPPRPRTGSPRTPCGLSARTFLCLRLRTGFPRTLCCSAHAPSCACAHGQALRERLLFQHLPASRPRISPPRAPCGLSARTFPPSAHGQPSANALRPQRTRVILPAFIS